MLSIDRSGPLDWNRIKTKGELDEQLKEEKGSLSKPVIDYLNSLINLEFSVIRNDTISVRERTSIADTTVYKNIAKFNIYHHALEIFGKNENVLIVDNSNGIEGVKVFFKDNTHPARLLFTYDYTDKLSGFLQACGKIEIELYTEGKKRKKEEIRDLKKTLKGIPQPKYSGTIPEGGDISSILFDRENIENHISALNDSILRGLSDIDRQEIELSNEFYKKLLEDYGLKKKDFEPYLTEEDLTDKARTEIPRTAAVYIKTHYI